MRAAPVGLAWSLAPDAGPLVREAVISGLPTHAHPVGVAGAVAIAAGVALCIRDGSRPIDPDRFLAFVADAVAGIETEPTPLRSDPTTAVTLHHRILEVGSLLDVEPRDVFAHFWSGAFALESVPAALYCFLRSPERPDEVVLTAANAGHDTDTIASMAGNLVGAHVGADRLRAEHNEWWNELEGRDELIDLADGLLDVAVAAGQD
jgi:ADP-ribosylglycohydrolase